MFWRHRRFSQTLRKRDRCLCGWSCLQLGIRCSGHGRARTLQREHYSVLALIGDGATTGGLAYEGLNDAGASHEPLIVILNDNEMSIAQNVGGMAHHLSKLRTRPGYFGVKRVYRAVTNRIPGGKFLYRTTHRVKNWMKNRLLDTTCLKIWASPTLGPGGWS